MQFLKCILCIFSFLKHTFSRECSLIVPNLPLTSIGLSTPFIYKNCDQTNNSQASFIEAVILNKNNGSLRIYSPLIVNANTQPLLPIAIPYIDPLNDIIGIWFGSNADTLTILGDTKKCTNGIPGSIFGQVAACNADVFFKNARQLIRLGILKIPPNGIGLNNKPCYTTRSFEVVDQDQSDNVITNYIAVGNRTAQYSQKNLDKLNQKGKIKGKGLISVLSNGSDNRLLDFFILPSLGCIPFFAHDIVSNTYRSSQALNELAASVNQLDPVALVPLSDPMVLVNGYTNILKLNAYRTIVNQPNVKQLCIDDTSIYCKNLINYGLLSLIEDSIFTTNFSSPLPNVTSNLFTFLGNRLLTTLNVLNCTGLLNISNPISIVTNITTGIITDLTFNL